MKRDAGAAHRVRRPRPDTGHCGEDPQRLRLGAARRTSLSPQPLLRAADRSDEAGRPRDALADARSFRRQLGAPAPGPTSRVAARLGGKDPAPPRPFGAAEGRQDGGDWAALVVRSAIAAARRGHRDFARSCGLDIKALARITEGETRPSAGELVEILARAGTRLRVRIEVYNDRDDGLCEQSEEVAIGDHRNSRRVMGFCLAVREVSGGWWLYVGYVRAEQDDQCAR